MDKLKAVFQECFGFPIPQSMLRGKKLVPLYGQPGDSLLFGSLVAVQNSCPVQGDIRNFIESSPEGYYKISYKDGRCFELKESLFENPDCNFNRTHRTQEGS